MIWKTDWQPANDYAATGTTEFARLLSNYNELKNTLNAEFGYAINFTTPATDGFRTFPFADVLNATENALNTLHVWTHEWINKVVTWQAGDVMPTSDDINRWEQNGQAIEAAMPRVTAAWFFMGELYMGEV